MKKLLKRLPLLLCGLGLAAALVYGFRPAPLPVDLAPVTRGPLQVYVEEDGKTRIKQRYIVAAPIAGRMRRILALFRLEFADPAEMRGDIAGRSVYLALAADENDVVKMKPQNLILNLPLNRT